jgi:ribosomal protein S18 acetylase RimI-like enzyme
MTEDQIVIATPAEQEAVIGTLTLAFSADPVMRWFWPEPDVYQRCFPRFVVAVAGGAFSEGTALCVDHGRGVALWLPPRHRGPDDEALTELMLESVEAGQLPDLAAFADMVQTHHIQTDHWYLPMTGVDPFVQGRGLGSRLLQHALAICDGAGLPAYLEASTTRSHALYARAGFKDVGRIQVGGSPVVWAMLREPDSSDREGRRGT